MEKKLYKSKNKKIFGVCGGLAEYLNTDVTVVRLIVVASVLFFGIGILPYLAAALIIPEQKD